MTSPYDSGFFSTSETSSFRASSSPSLFRVKMSSPYKNPLPKPNLSTISSVGEPNSSPKSLLDSPSSPNKRRHKGDRFIADRSSTDMSAIQFTFKQYDSPQTQSSPSGEAFKRNLAQSIFEPSSADFIVSSTDQREPKDSPTIPRDSILLQSPKRSIVSSPNLLSSPKTPAKMLSFISRTPNSESRRRVLPPPNQLSPTQRQNLTRFICSTADRTLDAPDIVDDYYLNLLDWGANNLVAVALYNATFLWNANTTEVSCLTRLTGRSQHFTSLSYSHSGQYLALGTNSTEIQLWDVESGKPLRKMQSHLGRITSLSWNDQILTSGSKDTEIHNHDVRIAQHHISTLRGHSSEVCGLKWSPDGTQLVSGSNDNSFSIWSMQDTSVPLFNSGFHHRAAVKALAWCPWRRNLLATGGGTGDRTIKFWNTSTCTLLNSIDARSQVCSLLWSKHVKELVSSHGFSQNNLVVWKYPSMTRQAELVGHSKRVLHTAMSPDGVTVVSAAPDETLRFWNVWDVSPPTTIKPSKSSEQNLAMKIIR